MLTSVLRIQRRILIHSLNNFFIGRRERPIRRLSTRATSAIFKSFPFGFRNRSLITVTSWNRTSGTFCSPRNPSSEMRIANKRGAVHFFRVGKWSLGETPVSHAREENSRELRSFARTLDGTSSSSSSSLEALRCPSSTHRQNTTRSRTTVPFIVAAASGGLFTLAFCR